MLLQQQQKLIVPILRIYLKKRRIYIAADAVERQGDVYIKEKIDVVGGETRMKREWFEEGMSMHRLVEGHWG